MTSDSPRGWPVQAPQTPAPHTLAQSRSATPICFTPIQTCLNINYFQVPTHLKRNTESGECMLWVFILIIMERVQNGHCLNKHRIVYQQQIKTKAILVNNSRFKNVLSWSWKENQNFLLAYQLRANFMNEFKLCQQWLCVRFKPQNILKPVILAPVTVKSWPVIFFT